MKANSFHNTFCHTGRTAIQCGIQFMLTALLHLVPPWLTFWTLTELSDRFPKYEVQILALFLLTWASVLFWQIRILKVFGFSLRVYTTTFFCRNRFIHPSENNYFQRPCHQMVCFSSFPPYIVAKEIHFCLPHPLYDLWYFQTGLMASFQQYLSSYHSCIKVQFVECRNTTYVDKTSVPYGSWVYKCSKNILKRVP